MRKPSMKDVLRETVVGSAFLASAGHIYSVAVAMGNHELIAGVHAVGVDGLVYIGIGAFRDGARVRGGLAVTYGGAVSLAFNYAAYNGGTLPPWVIAASMPIVLVLAVLVSMSGTPAKAVPERVPATRKRVPAAVPQDTQTSTGVPAVPAAVAEAVPADVPASVDEKRDKAFRMLDEGREKADVAATVGCSVRTLNRWISVR